MKYFFASLVGLSVSVGVLTLLVLLFLATNGVMI